MYNRSEMGVQTFEIKSNLVVWWSDGSVVLFLNGRWYCSQVIALSGIINLKLPTNGP